MLSPDATDWDLILKSQKEVMTNNQYIINEQIFNITRSSVDEVNEIITYDNEICKGVNLKNLETYVTYTSCIEEADFEIVRAFQMDKN